MMTPGNYTAHAIPQLLESAREFETEVNPTMKPGSGAYFAQSYRYFAERSRHAPKFMIPTGGRFFPTDFRGLPQELRLPFEAIVLEYADNWGRHAVLAVEYGDYIEMTAVQCWWGESNWQGIPKTHNLFRRARANQEGARKFVVPRDIPTDLRFPGHDDLNPSDEQLAALAFLEVLACSNVTTERIEAPAALNKKRVANGKVPFDSYHVLTIPAGARRIAEGPGTGTHASPRQHLRRGHIRRLDDQRTTWVNSCVVGDPTRGRVSKDYAVQ